MGPTRRTAKDCRNLAGIRRALRAGKRRSGRRSTGSSSGSARPVLCCAAPPARRPSRPSTEGSAARLRSALADHGFRHARKSARARGIPDRGECRGSRQTQIRARASTIAALARRSRPEGFPARASDPQAPGRTEFRNQQADQFSAALLAACMGTASRRTVCGRALDQHLRFRLAGFSWRHHRRTSGERVRSGRHRYRLEVSARPVPLVHAYQILGDRRRADSHRRLAQRGQSARQAAGRGKMIPRSQRPESAAMDQSPCRTVLILSKRWWRRQSRGHRCGVRPRERSRS